MAGPKELPQLVTELVDMSKEYVRQEALEPAKRLGRLSGMGLAAGAVFAFAALFLVLGVYQGLLALLSEGAWWVVLARGVTVIVAGGGAGLVGWRMSR
jgi:hypothetical protein